MEGSLTSIFWDAIVWSFFRWSISLKINSKFTTAALPVLTVLNSLQIFISAVTSHNTRSDTLQNGVITALDIIMTLGDLGYITYELNWIESLRGAFYVHSYFVEKINTDQTTGRCGFLYEVGDNDFKYPGPNYIFLASDERILNSPEHLRFFWDCL